MSSAPHLAYLRSALALHALVLWQRTVHFVASGKRIRTAAAAPARGVLLRMSRNTLREKGRTQVERRRVRSINNDSWKVSGQAQCAKCPHRQSVRWYYSSAFSTALMFRFRVRLGAGSVVPAGAASPRASLCPAFPARFLPLGSCWL